MEICFWVGSNGEKPEIIYFDEPSMIKAVAKENLHTFVDGFSSSGYPVKAWKVILDRETDEFVELTEDF